jgi:uncharacterized cupin superfamily protein
MREHEEARMAGKIDIEQAPTRFGTGYPEPFAERCAGRRKWRLGDAAGLTQFGVNLLRLPPGQWTAQRHWHHHEDEFVYVLEGEVVLVTEAGEAVMRAGDCAGFKAGVPDGHCLQNRSDGEAVLLEVGSRHPGGDGAEYPDVDLVLRAGEKVWRRRNGTAY